jgi:CheY-like chemotaxis protein
MLLDSGLSPEQRNLTRTVHESAESLLVIINDILDFSKIEAGKLTIKPHPFRLVHTLEAVMDLLAEEASRKQVNLALFIDGDVPQELVSDAGRLRQILINLLGNALKFTEQGYVLLHLSRLADGSIHFDVKDSGSGIPEAAQATLFDAFSQVDGSSTREHGGTGLGLAICNQLVSLLGGELSVNSTLGEGSCFSFTIPGGPIDKDAQPFIQANQMSVLMYSTDVTLNRYHEHQMREWNIQPKIVTTLNQCFSQIEAQDYQMIAIDADNLYYDPEHALGALSLVRSIRQTTDTQIVLYGSMQSFMSLELVKLGDNVTLMQKPLKHSEIQLMVDQEQLSAQKTAQLKPQQVPVSPAPEVAPPATEVTASPIMFDLLLAEDNSVNQMVATTMLKKLGYQVDVVNNGREALDAIQEKQYDLIFMDCQMPVLDGYAATGEIRQLTGEQSKIPIIALTAHAMMSNDQKCFDAGMDDYLAKPVRINELKNVLLKWQPKMLERRKAREAETRSDG